MRNDSLLLDFRALALKPVFSGEYLSEIITTHGVYYSKMSTIDLLEEACLRHYSSKAGRRKATQKLFKFMKKTPFLISDDVGVFPTRSCKNPECVWIFSNFFEMKRLEKNVTEIKFSNGTIVTVSVSLHTLERQKSRLHMVMSHAQQSKRTYIPELPFLGMNSNPDELRLG